MTGSYRGRNNDETNLVRNHENRRRPGEIPVVVPAELRYDPDPSYNAGDTKLVVRRRRTNGRDPSNGQRIYTYAVTRDFAILGGTDTNCAGGVIGDLWYTCEEVVNRGASGLKHGYNFAIPAYANGPVKAVAFPSRAGSRTRRSPRSTASSTRPRTARSRPTRPPRGSRSASRSSARVVRGGVGRRRRARPRGRHQQSP